MSSHFLEYLAQFLGDDVRTASFKRTADEFTAGEIENFDHKSRINGLLYGEVQSGKTSHTFAAIAATADLDEGFGVFIYLSTDNVPLQEQTYSRAIEALPTFQICSERDELRFNSTRLNQPVMVVLKKNSTVLKRWNSILKNSSRVKTGPIFIIDDEGDAAALNTKVNKDEESTVYSLISEMRLLGTSSIYLQVTATPQALLLQAEQENLKPQFSKYFEPGDGYLGGDYFYSELNRPTNYFLDENDLDNAISSSGLSIGLKHFVCVFMMTSAHLNLKGWTNVNALVHPAVGTGVHNQLYGKIKEYFRQIQDVTKRGTLDPELEAAYHDLKKSCQDLQPLNHLLTVARSLDFNVAVMNSTDLADKSNNYEKGFNLIVGANTLGRGVTFPHLQSIYYSRKAKQPQFDTAWQHSRIFGYDRDAASARIFMPTSLFKMFNVLQDANSLLRAAIKAGDLNRFQIIMPKGTAKPTRTNVLRASAYSFLVGGTSYFPPEPNQKNGLVLDGLFQGRGNKVWGEIDANFAKRIIDQASETALAWPATNFKKAIENITTERDVKVYLMVDRDRDIAKTGTVLSENDRKMASQQLKDEFVLIAYRLTGTAQGWNGEPFWMINVRVPDKYVYHSVLN
jgi:hypothetical protein